MKALSEFTARELYDLSDQDIERLIDLECAREGVPLLPAYPVTPEKRAPTPDLHVWEFPEFCLTDRLDAERIEEVLRTLKGKSGKGGYVSGQDIYAQVFHPHGDPLTSDEKFLYSEASLGTAQNKLVIDRDNRQAHDKARRAYDQIARDRCKVSERVYKVYREGLRKVMLRRELDQLWDRYWNLAEGQTSTALQFMGLAVNFADYDPNAHDWYMMYLSRPNLDKLIEALVDTEESILDTAAGLGLDETVLRGEIIEEQLLKAGVAQCPDCGMWAYVKNLPHAHGN